MFFWFLKEDEVHFLKDYKSLKDLKSLRKCTFLLLYTSFSLWYHQTLSDDVAKEEHGCLEDT